MRRDRTFDKAQLDTAVIQAAKALKTSTPTPPAGPNGAVQFDNSGVAGGDARFTFDPVTGNLTIGFITICSTDPGATVPAAGKVLFWVDQTTGQLNIRNAQGVTVYLGGDATNLEP